MSSSFRTQIVCPAKPGTRYGNRITALRWQSILRELGHRASIVGDWTGRPCDLLVALHAYRSAGAVRRFRNDSPHRRVVVALTGTDLYNDFGHTACQEAVRAADRLVVLQSAALDSLSIELRKKTHVIYQSVRPLSVKRPTAPRALRVTVAGHLREVKDPFRTAMSVRNLPADSRIQVHHYGGAMTAAMEERAKAEMCRNARYHWHGEIPRGVLRRRIATSWIMVLSSKMEGGANVVSEAISAGTPTLATRIEGSIGMLGEDYAGFFSTGKTAQLRDLLLQCEQQPSFYAKLCQQMAMRAKLVEPCREMMSWKRLIADLA